MRGVLNPTKMTNSASVKLFTIENPMSYKKNGIFLSFHSPPASRICSDSPVILYLIALRSKVLSLWLVNQILFLQACLALCSECYL